MTLFKPLLACEAELDKLRFPLMVSPKLDGIRCIIHGEWGPVTRNLKLIANVALREWLAKCPAWLDGELVAGSPTAKNCMQATTSAVMSTSGDASAVKLYAFDRVSDSPFIERFEDVGICTGDKHSIVQRLEHHIVETLEDLMFYEDFYVKQGYEGLMLRDPYGVYKHGRSTVREGILLKMKRFSDMEGTVAGFVERMHNGNEAAKDNLGRTKRSTAKAGKVGRGDLGALVLKIEGWESETVEVGSGFTDMERKWMWEARAALLGKRATFKYQAAGSKDAPRFPVFKGFREDNV